MMKSVKIPILVLVFILCLTDISFAASIESIPHDSTLIFSVDFQKIMKIEALKKIIDETLSAKTGEEKKALDEITARIGFNFQQDLHSALIFMDPKPDEITGNLNVGTIISGKFDVAKILELINTDKSLSSRFSHENLDGFNILATTVSENMNILFLDEGTIVMGPVAVLKKTIAARKEAGKNASAPFTGLLSELDISSSALWGGTIVTSDWKKQAAGHPMTAKLADAKAIVFSLSLDKDFIFNLTCEVEKEEQVVRFEESLGDCVDALKGFAADTPEIVEILNDARVESKDNMSRIFISIPRIRFDKLMETLNRKTR